MGYGEREVEYRRVKVTLAALRFFPDYAGPGIRFRRYAPGLKNRGIDLRAVSGVRRGERPELASRGVGDLTGVIELDDLVVRQVVVPERNVDKRIWWAYGKGLARACLGTGRHPDVIQLLDLPYVLMAFILRARRRRIPMVYTHTMIEGAPEGWLSVVKKALWRLPFRSMDVVVVSSNIMKRDLVKRGIRARIDVIPNGVDLAKFHPLVTDKVARRRATLGLPVDGELVLFVGGFLQKRKGLDVVAASWRDVAKARPKAHLVVVGPRIDEFRAEGPQREFLEVVQGSLEASGAADRVIYTGRVDNVQEYLQVADLFVFASRREGMPNVVAEAFACGIPTIMTPFIGLPGEFGRPGKEYLLVARNEVDVGNAIIAALGNDALRESLGRQGRRWVERELDVQDSLDAYADLYRELARRCP